LKYALHVLDGLGKAS